MALVSCPDCSHPVSPEEVEVCPQCGYPIREVYYGRQEHQEEEAPPSPPSPEAVPKAGGYGGERSTWGASWCWLSLLVLCFSWRSSSASS